MKALHNPTLKRDITALKRGTRRAVTVLTCWIDKSPDKEVTKKRLLITVSVPVGLFLLGTSAPGVAIALAILMILGAVLWFSRTQEQAMRIRETDTLGAFSVKGRAVDFEGLLDHLAEENPDGSLKELADLLFDFGGPDLTDRELADEMRANQVNHRTVAPPVPAQEKPKVPESSHSEPPETVPQPAPQSLVPQTSESSVSVPEPVHAGSSTYSDGSTEVPPVQDKQQFTEAEREPSPTSEKSPGEGHEDPVPHDAEGSSGMFGKIRGMVQAKLG